MRELEFRFEPFPRLTMEQSLVMTPAQKMAAGPDLFELWQDVARAQLREHFPNATEQHIQDMIRIYLD
jgi:hypothetical protein